jgi:predicted CXXCH cytochrome family protein
VVIPNISEKKYGYKILSNTTETLTVEGVIDLSRVTATVDTFAIIYGKLIQSKIKLDELVPPKTGEKMPKFFDVTGTNSFADGDTEYDGVCEVCHTLTTHFRNDGLGTDQDHTNMGAGIPGSNCTDCHKHESGFQGMGGGAHTTHVTKGYGPQLGCEACHGTEIPPTLANGENLANTTVCDNCHGGGSEVGTAKSYWGNAGSSEGEGGSWAVVESESSFCGSCHDTTSGNTKGDGTGDTAPNVMGDNSTYGFDVTGHGKTSGNYMRLSWQDLSSTGNPAANRLCSSCHELTAAHFDNATDRLKAGYENDANNSNCQQCHYSGGMAYNGPEWYTTYMAYSGSAHGDAVGKLKCTDCHDVHGASGAFVGMTKANQESLCYQCHTEGVVQNDSITIWDQPYCWVWDAHSNCSSRGNHTGTDNQAILTDETAGKPAWPVDSLVGTKIRNIRDGSSGTITANTDTTVTTTLSGGTENDWDRHDTYAFENKVADDIQEAFTKAEVHDLGTSYAISGNNYSLECITCHNVHIITGKYWEADQDKSPVSRITNNTAVWGGSAGEKMDDYANTGTYQTPQNDPFTGSELPDYSSFCLDCHGEPTGHANFNINWDNDSHGKKQANGPSGFGVCPNWHGCGKAESWNDDNCLADDGGSSGTDCWPVTPRGRGDQIHSRQPYDHEARIGGANFTLSCTDCHEAHGSDVSSMLRPSPNAGIGTYVWNANCNNCHYYFSDWHAGTSCGTASCHAANSIHRIGSGGTTGGTRTFDPDLVVHYAFQNNLRDSSSTWLMDGIWTLDRHNPNVAAAYCQGPGDPSPCCTGFGTGACNSGCVAAGDPLPCCTGAGTGTCEPTTCVEVGVPYACCTGPGTGTCVSECVGLDDPYPCCTSAARGTCNDTDPKRVCEWYDNPDKVGSFVSGRFGNAVEINDQPVEVGTEHCIWSNSEGYHGTWKYTEMKYNMTLESWVYPTVDDGERKIMAKHTYKTGGYALVLNNINGSLRAGLLTNVNGGHTPFDDTDCNGLRGAFSTMTIPLNQWTHVAATYDYTGPDRNDNDGSVGRIRIYVNGEDVTDSYNDVFLCYTQPGAGEDAMFPHSDWNDIDAATMCWDGHWCAAVLSVGGLNWSDPNNNFIGRLDEVKVWNVTKDDTYFESIDSESPPRINSVLGQLGASQLQVTFTEGVYAYTFASGALEASDFTLTDTNADNPRTVTGVTHTAGEPTATVTMSQSLIPADVDADTLAAVSLSIFDEYSIDAGTDPVTIGLVPVCPASPVSIQLNEAPGSSFIQDSQNILYGTVNGVGTLTGTEFSGGGTGSGRYIMFDYNTTCLQADTAMTLEARIKPTGLGGTADFARRVLARDSGANYQLSVWRKNSFGNNYNAPDGEASIALWVSVSDNHGGNNWKAVLTNYTGAATGSENECPIVSDHWYLVKAVWDTNKPGGTPGQLFVPADIYVDDQGTDGAGAGEKWGGYINCTDTDESLKDDDTFRFYTADEIKKNDGNFAIGVNRNNTSNNLFNGLIDWITWKDSVD